MMALPWAQASQTYRRAHPQLKHVGGYPMDTRGRALAARSYAIAELNAGNLTRGDATIIYHRTSRRWDLPTRTIACAGTGRRRRCQSTGRSR